MTDATPHSQEVLGDWRDGWWHRDYLELVASRLGMATLRSVVDVGCGRGHWGRVIAHLVHPEATVLGVDREHTWVDEATALARDAGLTRLTYRQGTAEALPAPDASADLVTCQTVLMHVASPEAALREMLRVLRPGGLLLLSEPSNLAASLLLDSVKLHYDPARMGRIAEFAAAIRQGRIALGEGDECIGDRLPQLLHTLGMVDITTTQNERVNPILAPVTSAGMLEAMGPYPELVRSRGWRFGREHAWRLYAAGGGTQARFDLLHGEFVAQGEETLAQVEAGTFWSSMGHSHYLIAARKT